MSYFAGHEACSGPNNPAAAKSTKREDKKSHQKCRNSILIDIGELNPRLLSFCWMD